MRKRIVQTATAAAAVMLALMVARGAAFAHSDQESCSAKSTNVTRMNSDGTQAACDAAAGPPNKATAKASDLGSAESEADDGATASSDASGTDSQSSSEAVNGGKATSKATGSNSNAIS
jgi:hypothetical protein